MSTRCTAALDTITSTAKMDDTGVLALCKQITRTLYKATKPGLSVERQAAMTCEVVTLYSDLLQARPHCGAYFSLDTFFALMNPLTEEELALIVDGIVAGNPDFKTQLEEAHIRHAQRVDASRCLNPQCRMIAAKKKCSVCMAKYCSSECQHTDWVLHRKTTNHKRCKNTH